MMLLLNQRKAIQYKSLLKNFVKNLKKHSRKIYGIFNDIELIVDQYENPASLYWQYMYKLELERSK